MDILYTFDRRWVYDGGMERILRKTDGGLKRIIRIIAITAMILLVPLVAMQLTREVKWSPFDFTVMGSLLFAVGVVYEFFVRRLESRRLRIGGTVLLLVAFLLVWLELAVGLVGAPTVSQ